MSLQPLLEWFYYFTFLYFFSLCVDKSRSALKLRIYMYSPFYLFFFTSRALVIRKSEKNVLLSSTNVPMKLKLLFTLQWKTKHFVSHAIVRERTMRDERERKTFRERMLWTYDFLNVCHSTLYYYYCALTLKK